MAEYYQIDGITFTLGATLPSSPGIGQNINYFFGDFLPGATYYFAVVSYNSLGFSGYVGLRSVYVPEAPHIPVALTWFTHSVRNPYIAKAYRPYGNIFPHPSPAPPGVPDEGFPTAEEVKAWFDGNTSESGIRAIIPEFIHNSFFAPGLMGAGSYGISYQNCYHPDDACIDAFGNVVQQELFNIPTNADPTLQTSATYKGNQSFASPWLDGAAQRVKTFWSSWLESVEAEGITFDYFMGNIADTTTPSPINYFSNMTRREGNYGAGYTLHHGYILNDPRAESLTAGNAAIYGNLKSQLLIDQGYTLTDFTVLEIADGTTGAYKLLNFVMGRLGAYYINEGYYEPVKQRYPQAQVSNYSSYKILKEDEVPDYNGHKQYFDVKIGNAKSPTCYAEMLGAGSVYKVNVSDPTKLSYSSPILPEERYGYDSGGNISAWKAFILDQQKIRALIRNMEPGEKLHPWIKSRSDGNNGALGGYSAVKREEYWAENIYHICMFNPEAFFYFNQFGQETLVTDLLEEVSNLKSGKRALLHPQNKNKINFNTKFLASGCRIYNGSYVWRITTNYDTVNTVAIHGKQIDVTENHGFWYFSLSDVGSIIETEYDSVEKILTLDSSNEYVPLVPNVPSSLQAQIGNPLYYEQVLFSWNDNSDNEEGFAIYYREV